jgi:hypothetical protein
LLLAVQPIGIEHKGAWAMLERFLVRRLQHDPTTFSGLYIKLADQNATNWLKIMRGPGSFEWLISEMRGKNIEELVGWLVFSVKAPSRRLGLFLFEELSIRSLPSTLMDGIDERGIRLAFYESQMNSLDGEAVARFLIVLLPYLQRCDPAFQKEFYDELVLEAKNYGGACRDEFGKRANEFPLLKEALGAAERYVEALQKLEQSCIRAMEVSGYQHAARIAQRHFANAVSQGAEQSSVFMKLFKKVALLYGRQWSSFYEGKLSKPFSLQKISTSMELPRLEEIDPEGMVLRRLHAVAQVHDLSKEVEETKGT